MIFWIFSKKNWKKKKKKIWKKKFDENLKKWLENHWRSHKNIIWDWKYLVYSKFHWSALVRAGPRWFVLVCTGPRCLVHPHFNHELFNPRLLWGWKVHGWMFWGWKVQSWNVHKQVAGYFYPRLLNPTTFHHELFNPISSGLKSPGLEVPVTGESASCLNLRTDYSFSNHIFCHQLTQMTRDFTKI